jgi:hypothetical protein
MNMTDAILTICSPGETWRVHLKPQSMVIGRNPTCDIVIDRAEVSRRHAEISRTPANQWMIKDLDSSNGTFVNGKRIDSCILTAEDVVEIGPVSLLLGEGLEHRAVAAPWPQRPKIIVEDFGTEVFYDRPRIGECTTQPYPERLEQVRKRLSELTDPRAAYPAVCRALAQGPTTAAVIFRLPPADRPMPKTPQVVAYHFGSSGEDTHSQIGDGMDPFHRGFRVSHRLLEAVRANGQPLMTKSIFSCDTQVTISLIDEHSPRALMCTSIVLRKDVIDLLYIDVPIEDRIAHGPEEMFAFVQAVAHEAASVAVRLAPAIDGAAKSR